MAENNDPNIVSENRSSAGDLFNELIIRIIEKRSPKVGVIVNNADEQILVQNWLATKHVQDFLKQAQKGKYTSIGVVHRIDESYGQIKVGIIDKWGKFVFVYQKGAERFKEAPNGFEVGDVVLQEMDGTTINSVKPLSISKEVTLKVLDKIRRSRDQISDSA